MKRTRRQPERVEQRGIIQLLLSVGCPKVYVSGTHRRRGDYQGTMQTPGIPDLEAFLPNGLGILKIEVKASGGRPSPEQREYRAFCLACESPYQVHHVVGGLDSVIAYLITLGLLKPQHVPYYRLPKGPTECAT